MKIYVAHSKQLNYLENLYRPIREDKELQEHTILLPHEESNDSYNSREFYKDLSIMIAEVSYPATGMGIELCWAYDYNVPIYCLFQKNMKVSNSLKSITKNIIEYENEKDLLNIIKEIIKREKQ